MLISLDDLRKIRKNLGITQKELAEKAAVSQSLIAKIESGRIDPSYSNAKKILSTLQGIAEHKEKKAHEVMTKKILSLKPREKTAKAIEIMKKHAISQLPIIEENNVLGLISETTIINNLDKDFRKIAVGKIMEEAPPIVSRETSIDIVSDMLKFFPLIIVSKRGKLEGVITKSNLFRSIKS